MTAKPVQIQPVVWICTKPLYGKPFDEPFITTNEAYVKLHKDYDWQPLVPQAALSRVRASLLQLEAKWRSQCKTLAIGEPDFSDGIAAGKQEAADDLATLASTLGDDAGKAT